MIDDLFIFDVGSGWECVGELELNDVVSSGLTSEYRSDRHVGLKSEEYRWVTSE